MGANVEKASTAFGIQEKIELGFVLKK